MTTKVTPSEPHQLQLARRGGHRLAVAVAVLLTALAFGVSTGSAASAVGGTRTELAPFCPGDIELETISALVKTGEPPSDARGVVIISRPESNSACGGSGRLHAEVD